MMRCCWARNATIFSNKPSCQVQRIVVCARIDLLHWEWQRHAGRPFAEASGVFNGHSLR